MILPESKVFNSSDFLVSDGNVLQDLTIAYQTWGKLNSNKDNAILICHGYTNHHFPEDQNVGWFNNLMGFGKAVDTNKYFVICANMLGSSFGSTGPKSINPMTNLPFGSDFPLITNIDIINTQKLLIENLKIRKLHSIIGYSFGGHLVYLWATEFPNMMKNIVSIAGSFDRWDVSKEKIELIEEPFSNCKNWNNGHYYSLDRSEIDKALIDYRINVLNFYGFKDYLLSLDYSLELVNKKVVEAAKGWAKYFDPNSLIILRRANLNSSASNKVSKIQVPILKVLAKSDKVTNMVQGNSTVQKFASLGINCTFIELNTKFGHHGPMCEPDEWSKKLQLFLNDNDNII